MTPTDVRTAPRVLAAIPAYNEAQTIADIVRTMRAEAPQFDLLVVDDGSRDGTRGILHDLGVRTATHLCNLGYGRALQTAIIFAGRHGYDALITLDADGQHQARDLGQLYAAFCAGDHDMLIGSRFVDSQEYGSQPFSRRLGMRLFSTLITLLTRHRIYDTSSGMKVIHRRVFDVLSGRSFVDFHAEAIVYLIEAGYRVGEFPITVHERRHGQSMYTTLSAVKYPLKVSFLILVGTLEARSARRRRHG